jgi:hypothetical protein
LTTRSFSTSALFGAGTHTAAVRVSDGGGQSAITAASNTFTVAYRMSGLLAPFNADGSSVWKAGSTIPVKVRISDCSGTPVPGLSPTVGTSLVNTSSPSDSVDEAASTSTADAGNTMRYDASSGQYVYNFASKALTDLTATYFMYVRLAAASGQSPTGTPTAGQSWQRFGLKKR